MAENWFTLTPALRLRPPSGLRTPSSSPPRSSAHACSRSRSRSPDRNFSSLIHTSDPLLANLSPESTLSALSTTDAIRTSGAAAEGILSRAIAEASTVERALAVRAAVAGQNLKQWHAEVLAWEWPQKQDAASGKGFLPANKNGLSSDDTCGKYLGCLPAATVLQHEDRVSAIKAGMEALDVEELKEHVLNAHIPARSRPSSSNSTWSTNLNTLSYVQLSDFTAVITATILQTLPYLSKLNILLNIWDVRLTVLHQIPELLDCLGSTKRDIDGALDRLRTGLLPELGDPSFSKSSFNSARHKLENKVLMVGSKMDRILDSLEGQEDALPEDWIDEMEAIENRFATWSYEAEKIASENDFRRSNISLLKSSMQSNKAEMPEKPGPEDSTANSEAPPLEKDMENKYDNLRIVIELSSIQVEPVPPTRPCETNLVPKDAISPASTDNQQISYSPPTFPQVQRPVEEPALESIDQAPPTELSHEAELVQAKLNNTQSSSGASSAQPYTPTSSASQGDISTLSFPDAPNLLACGPNVDGLSNPPLQQLKDNASGGHSGSEPSISPSEPCSWVVETPGSDPGSLGSDHISPEISTKTNGSFPGSPSGEKSNDPTSPQSPKPKISPDGRFSPTNNSTSSSPTTAEISPRKLINNRPGALKLDITSRRRDSIVSIASTVGSGLSYVSNAEIKDAQLATAHGSPIVVESPSGVFTTSSRAPWALGHGGSILSQTNTAELGNKSNPASRPPVQRSMSLPLERFMGEDPRPIHDLDRPSEPKSQPEVQQASSPSIDVLPKTEPWSVMDSNRPSIAHTNGPKSMPNLRRSVSSLAVSSIAKFSHKSLSLKPNHTRGPRISTSSESLASTAEESSPSICISQSRNDTIQIPGTPTPPPNVPRRSSKRLSRLLSPVTSISSSRARNDQPSIQGSKLPRRAATNSLTLPPINTPRSPEDQLEEKINSILTSIPTRIHLASTPENTKSNKSTPRAPEHSYSTPNRDRFPSHSPASSRSNTPTPSLTLTPAFGRSRRSHTHPEDESAVRLYHLHRGGKAAPLKLFVRSVGEDGERVMVRVGGGWADLGEYLREYAVHHGRRNVTDAKFEVRGLPNNNASPNYSTQSSHAPVPTTGCSTPVSRPGSAFDIRPSSSLNIRKTRRSAANTSELPTLTTSNIEKASEGSTSSNSGPLSFLSSARRRLSTSSNASMSVASTYGGDTQYASTPLGLAGPNPKSRQVSISPESEAWVEDVVGRARRTSATLRPERSYGNLRRFRPNALHEDALRDRAEGGHRSVSDTGSGGNKRVYLRGLDRGKGNDI
ncbi:hypothetical protein AJ78_08797 [Emergomyces pasteurianus Ep9510]|uniref:GAR domain-containing protein n=1 Tax=Emergomyces pasteurianus Ep9510 TaxID=1447872 RepID=A0A1J9PQ93_9EURO|nr:hypothetical protein AJ78_08797 [Emergomyces pasteurianus Ep9510]